MNEKNEKVLDHYLTEVSGCYYGYEIAYEIEKGDQTIYVIKEYVDLHRNHVEYVLVVEDGKVYSMDKSENLSDGE